MLLVALRKGGVKCSNACPFYEQSGVVRGYNGPLKTHCRSTMDAVSVDCDLFNPMHIENLEVSEEQWKKMQECIGKKARKVRKTYDPDHEAIHPVGCEWTHRQSLYNADKSARARKDK